MRHFSGNKSLRALQILFRVCVDHPYHVVAVVLALANANRDDDYSNKHPSIKRKSTTKKPAPVRASVFFCFFSVSMLILLLTAKP